MIKIRATPAMETIQRPKSPVKKNGKTDKVNNSVSQPVIVDLEKDGSDNKNEIPRPPNAFMIFTKEWRKKLAVEHPAENSKDISIRLGNLWKTLTPEMKEKYYSEALSALKEHELKYPQAATKPQPLKKRKIIISAIKKSENVVTSNDPMDIPSDDLEIIEPPDISEPISQNSNNTVVST